MNDQSLAIILAAGEGTRMKSKRPKVLHEIGGRSMLGHVLAAVQQAGVSNIVVVIGPDRDDVAAEIARVAPTASTVVQRERLGTAHAVLHAREALARGPKSVVVLFGDTPLVEAETISRLLRAVDSAGAAALGFEADDPTGYGRLIMDGTELVAIREHKDATAEQRAITFCNGGLMALEGRHALAILEQIGNDNAQREYYLPDAIEVARRMGLSCAALKADGAEVLGVNDRVQLAAAEAHYQKRLRERHMRNGVTMQSPETVFLSHDTVIGPDVTIKANVVIGPGVSIESGTTIHAFSHLEGATIGADASVGPFARLRPGSALEAKVKVGNFVEIKASRLGVDAKASHLSYIGDSEIGAGANIGAGTITCNYDGFSKFRTVVGEGAFIGSNSSLVAPVKIGAGAFVGSGSVIVSDVAPGALAVARGRQVEKPGWAAAFTKANGKQSRK
ncbi:MAG: bifunctional UDP-N-acetylglucosamine diphosphorylase/glucosamine-1-phosphate N-acetyltransferase GlmU [Beijerinckiaceae bacterium]|nr:bifunctional UDP-N-acetylglucosamine diphosphorylase/glucosamine-1-phosphate N-acetyltransferase GlmU [Beijerinckiaceae bacterium]